MPPTIAPASVPTPGITLPTIAPAAASPPTLPTKDADPSEKDVEFPLFCPPSVLGVFAALSCCVPGNSNSICSIVATLTSLNVNVGWKEPKLELSSVHCIPDTT